jgi:hypothetical protein
MEVPMTNETHIDDIETNGADGEQGVPRRNMLKVLGTAAAGAAVGSVALSRTASAADGDALTLGEANDATTPTWLATNPGFGGPPDVGAFHVTNDAGVEANDPEITSSLVSAIGTGAGGGAQDVAFWGWGAAIAAKFDGPVPLQLVDRTGSTPTAEGEAGQFKVYDGQLWFCVQSDDGNGDAEWRRLTGPTDAGSFTPVPPTRVYDSRLNMAPTPGGPLQTGQNRVVPVRQARDINTGTVVPGVIVVPDGARAVSFTVTVVDTVNRGFLYVAPSTTTAVAGSTINWATNVDGAVANSSQVLLGGDREIRVFAGGSAAAAHFIIDINGYYG